MADLPAPLHAKPALPAPNQPAVQVPAAQQINWSHFRSDFTGKPEEDVEAHLLHTND